MQALREGWDCPSAYVLCSVQAMRSATAVEQLLGRVLRMPYGRPRSRPALNKAYAHVTESETGLAANALADRLIDGMGFDPLDLASMLTPQLPLGLPDDGPLFRHLAPALPALAIDLPAGKPLPAAVQAAVDAGSATLSSDGERQRVVLRGAVAPALGDALVAGAQAPSQRGVAFAAVPRLWAERSAGRAVFAMVYLQERGMTMAQQLAAALG